jgi:phosphomannomutase
METFSGIRGVYDDGLDEQVALRYSYSYLSFLKNKNNKKIKIVIGTDTRPSRKILKNAVIESLDCEVIDLGIASTPMVEFCVRHYKASGGIIITASHNEPYWNGFKFLDKDGGILKAEDMDKIIKLYSKIKKLSNEKFSKNYLYKNFNLKSRTIQKKYDESNKEYVDYVLSFLSKNEKQQIRNSGLKVIIDPNGGAGVIARPVLEKLKVNVKGLNMKYGSFNRAVEPNEDSLFYLSNEVRIRNYDFAAGFDCDADRIEIVTRKGMVSGNELLAMIADNILSKAKNKTIVVNNATSLMVREIAKKHNAKYVETEVGETNVVSAMYRLKASIGGEGSSGGIIIPDSRCRDGILTLIFILKILAEKGKKIEELVGLLPGFYNLRSKVTIDSKKYSSTMKKVNTFYKKKNYKINKSGTSLKIMPSSNSFVWFRSSKTEANVLRVIVDSRLKKQSEELMKEALSLIK